MMQPVVSAIVPTFNAAQFVGAALRSVATQELRGVELIVVDDGSSDGTRELVEQDPCFRELGGTLIRRPVDSARGAGACRNRGAQSATAPLLAFLDSDDEWLPEHLQRAVAALDAAPDSVAYCCAGLLIGRNGQQGSTTPAGGFPACGTSVNVLPALLTRMFVPNQTLVVRRDAFTSAGGYSTRLTCYEDWWLCLQLATRGPFVIDDATGCHIHTRGASLSRSLRKGQMAMSVQMYTDKARLVRQAAADAILQPAGLHVLRESVATSLSRQVFALLRARHIGAFVRVSAGRVYANPGLSALVLKTVFARAARLATAKGPSE